ncbi:hypothetical protein [Streptomyces mirabilis]|uniref:hypothetical protein n=1 Tax=Streptomyces mirabilis TaxID=68239 RepID=UPI00224F0164|nr:hypothetical protein [Streptomyces mirabilis]MCX4617774.1 hypothetical protein [Streptomyces mirabilis]
MTLPLLPRASGVKQHQDSLLLVRGPHAQSLPEAPSSLEGQWPAIRTPGHADGALAGLHGGRAMLLNVADRLSFVTA